MSDIWGIIITNLLVIIGWFIVFRQALKIRHRDDLRKIVDLSAETIDDIYNRCCIYYSDTKCGHINHNSTNIRAKFVLLSHYLLMLKSAGISSEISSALTQYKIHSMGGYFETIDFLKQIDIPNWSVELASSAQELRYRIERGYFDLSSKGA